MKSGGVLQVYGGMKLWRHVIGIVTWRYEGMEL